VTFPPDWNEFISLLCSNRVRFVIVGAHALAANGVPRATGDLNVFVEPSAENARRMTTVLESFGFPALAEAAEKLAEPDRMATTGRVPLRIDIMTSIDGVSFEQAYEGRLEARLGPHLVPFLGLRELVTNKRKAGRTKDLLDIALLEEAGLLDSER